MFLFGLFSAHLPYIMFIALYILYFLVLGASSFIFHSTAENLDQHIESSSKNFVIHSHALKYSYLVKKAYNYQAYQKQQHSSFKHLLDTFIFCNYPIIYTFTKGVNKSIVGKIFSGIIVTLFSRPPPII